MADHFLDGGFVGIAELYEHFPSRLHSEIIESHELLYKEYMLTLCHKENKWNKFTSLVKNIELFNNTTYDHVESLTKSMGEIYCKYYKQLSDEEKNALPKIKVTDVNELENKIKELAPNKNYSNIFNILHDVNEMRQSHAKYFIPE